MNIAAYPKYDVYSNREWIGNSSLPAHWSVKALKHGARIVLGKMLCPENKGGYLLRPYLKSKNIQWLSVDTSSVDEMWFSPQEIKQYRLVDGDLILSEGGEVGKTCIWNSELSECYIQNSAHKVTMYRENESRYFLYQMYALGKYGSFDAAVNRVSIAHLTYEKLSNIDFAFPPLSEQRAIASFLDNKCAKIDEAVRIKEAQITLLRERRQILIQQAVTRGLNPDVPMKDSGIDWIGQIPAHWEVRKVKQIFRLAVDAARKNNSHELLSIYTDIGVRPRKDLEERGNKASTTDGYWIVKKGDFIVNKLLAWMGAVGLSEYDGVTSPAYDILRPRVLLNGHYFHRLFRSKSFSLEIKRFSRGIMEMRLRIYFDKLGVLEVPFPSKTEQDEIIAYLNEHEQKIEQAISIKQEQISRLKEYKTSLINAAVTGKIKVS